MARRNLLRWIIPNVVSRELLVWWSVFVMLCAFTIYDNLIGSLPIFGISGLAPQYLVLTLVTLLLLFFVILAFQGERLKHLVPLDFFLGASFGLLFMILVTLYSKSWPVLVAKFSPVWISFLLFLIYSRVHMVLVKTGDVDPSTLSVPDESHHDSYYYLGFILTLLAMVFAISGDADVSTEDGRSRLLELFSIAMLSTLLGLVFRTLSQARDSSRLEEFEGKNWSTNLTDGQLKAIFLCASSHEVLSRVAWLIGEASKVQSWRERSATIRELNYCYRYLRAVPWSSKVTGHYHVNVLDRLQNSIQELESNSGHLKSGTDLDTSRFEISELQRRIRDRVQEITKN